MRSMLCHWLEDADEPTGEKNVAGSSLVSSAAVQEHRRLSQLQITRKVFVTDMISLGLCFTLN